MNISKVNNSTSPLCFLPDGRLLCYRRGNAIVMRDNMAENIFLMPMSTKERLLGWSRMASRLFRFGVRAAETIDENNVVLSIGNTLFELNIERGEMSKGWYCGDGIRPLIFTMIKGIKGFDDGVCFGGYRSNKGKGPVHIYHRSGIDQWNVVYTFPQGAINHVHNVVADPYRQCLWIFTGDFDEASAIWKATDGFKKVERVVCNDQKYRACVVFALPEGLLYATDAPFADDYICLMNTDTLDVETISPIHGSCIYGCRWKNKYVFSSTVEGDGREMNRLEWLFSRKRGAGIKDNYVHLYEGNLEEGFNEIYKGEKDCLPFYTFQFGVFKFPAGYNSSNTLYFQPIGTKKHDMALLSLRGK